MSGRANTVLGYLAARSRGDEAFGAPGEIGGAPPLRPRRRPVAASGDAAASPFGFVEEHAEIERTAPHRRRPAADAIPDVASDRPIQAAPAPDAAPGVVSEHGTAPTPARPPLHTSLAATEVATPIETPPPPTAAISATATSAPVKTSSQTPAPERAPARRNIPAELPPPPPTPIAARAAPDRTIVETSQAPARTVVQSPAAMPSIALTIVQSELVSSKVDEAPPGAIVTDRPPPPQEQLADRVAPSRPEAPFERPAENPRAAREAPASPPLAPQVQITIGRVEIRAAAPPAAPTPRGPVMSLDDYLAKRAGG